MFTWKWQHPVRTVEIFAYGTSLGIFRCARSTIIRRGVKSPVTFYRRSEVGMWRPMCDRRVPAFFYYPPLRDYLTARAADVVAREFAGVE